MHRIPFNKPILLGKEIGYIRAAFENSHTSGNGPISAQCRRRLEDLLGANHVLLTTSGTAALEMAALALDVKPGDEIILPSFTFPSCANAFLLRGAKLKFIDIRSDTKNLDERQLEHTINSRTKAVVPVHYAGVACAMDEIMTLSDKWGFSVIEDAAHAIGSKYKGQSLGAIGHFAAFSFHESKNVSSGEGGALVTRESRYRKKVEILHEKGTNRWQMFKGKINKYNWVDIGSSFVASDLMAAMLLPQLENFDDMQSRRREVFNHYMEGLLPLAKGGNIELPVIPSECTTNYHLTYLCLQDQTTRDNLIEFLEGKGIKAVFHYLPLHTSPKGLELGYKPGMFPVTESVSQRLLRLPMFYALTISEQNVVIDGIFEFFGVSR